MNDDVRISFGFQENKSEENEIQTLRSKYLPNLNNHLKIRVKSQVGDEVR